MNMGGCTSSSNAEKFELIDTYKLCYRYKRFIHPEHEKLLKTFGKFQYQFLGAKMVHSMRGDHWSNCVWSEDSANEGPDTCICYTYATRKSEVLKMVELYEAQHICSIKKYT